MYGNPFDKRGRRATIGRKITRGKVVDSLVDIQHELKSNSLSDREPMKFP